MSVSDFDEVLERLYAGRPVCIEPSPLMHMLGVSPPPTRWMRIRHRLRRIVERFRDAWSHLRHGYCDGCY